jgi:transposase
LIFRSKHKNDRNDAERLAKLLYLGEMPTEHVPTLAVRTWRELINCRSQVIAKRTRAKNTVRALLRSAGVVPPTQPGLWTKKGLAWLRKLDLPGRLPFYGAWLRRQHSEREFLLPPFIRLLPALGVCRIIEDLLCQLRREARTFRTLSQGCGRRFQSRGGAGCGQKLRT